MVATCCERHNKSKRKGGANGSNEPEAELLSR
jgi:hypothetical protein